jgi:hypothetical protein
MQISSELKNILNTYQTITTDAGCIIEYNMNNMLDSISASYPENLDIKYKTHFNSDGTVVDSFNKYKKLFPVDSVTRPVRPQNSGVKYFIWTEDKTEVELDGFESPRVLIYPEDKARVYYPGVDNEYKYWVTPINEDADITINYSVSTAKVTQAYFNGTSIVYKTLFPHAFPLGAEVSISGLTTSAFNLSNVTISNIIDQYTFEVLSSTNGNWAENQNGIATLSSPTKPAVANKIVIRFEKFHDKPTSASVSINSQSSIPLSIPASDWDGLYTLYYNGSTWVSSEPSTISNPISISSIRVQANNSEVGKAIGLIEVSARWYKDISSDIVSMKVAKESSIDNNSILPVGYITANDLDINIIKYDQDQIQILEYNRNDIIDSSKIYLYKNVELRPYIKVEGNKLQQGHFYIKSFSIDTYGSAEVTALDSAKILMETIAPEILCESYPATAIIRRLLDSIGFTNYNFNVEENDSSIPVINYWFSTNTQTVWGMIQDICRDIQMNAFFDENNILQFYSRNKIYSNLNVDWQFFYDTEMSGASILGLPNIQNISKQEIASANEVQILWSSPVTSNYLGNSTFIWQSPATFLGAGGLKAKIEKDSPPVDTVLDIDLNTYADAYSNAQSLYNFNGYVLINSEIIEYDAIQYQYVPKEAADNSTPEKVWIESALDLNKYRFLSKSGFKDPKKPETAFFKPTGKYRVKTRGALGTQRGEHPATAIDFVNNSSVEDLSKWNQRLVQFK